MADPKTETPLTKRIFDAFVMEGKDVVEIARELDIPHQTVSQTTNSDQFNDMAINYWENFKDQISPQQKIKLMQAKHKMIDRLPDVVKNVLKVAVSRNDAAGIKAAELVFNKVGLQSPEEAGSKRLSLEIKIPAEAVDYARSQGMDIVETYDLERTPYAAKMGKEIGAGVRKLDDPEHNADDETGDSSSGE